jgi:hypothetical protein
LLGPPLLDGLLAGRAHAGTPFDDWCMGHTI